MNVTYLFDVLDNTMTKNLWCAFICCRVDPDSTLHKDLMQLKAQEETDHVLLNMTFTVSNIIE